MQKPRLKHIKVSDNYRFPYSVHAINACFGKNYRGYQRATICPYSSRSEGFAWFPKLAIIKDGEEVAQDSVYGCINTLSADGMAIRERHSVANGRSEYCVRYVFVKPGKDKPYQYVGNFKKDMEASTATLSIYRKISDELDLSEWYYVPLNPKAPLFYFQEDR
ncbi:MAG: hypothetical protein IKE28_12710 [Solobacterium sp.]|nr:hypothetical protein [Solobacterium sp.]